MKSRSILYAVIALIVLVGLIFVLRQPSKSTSSQTNSTSTQAKEYSFVLKDKKLSSGPDKINVTEGDKVKITVSSDADYPELHLHGYELKTPIKKDAPATVEFTANKTGSYVLEVHFVEEAASSSSSGDTAPTGNELQISHLEVQPK